jgi:hypothetical protein
MKNVLFGSRWTCIFGVCLAAFGSPAQSNSPAIHLVNDLGQEMTAVLNGGSPFTTDFKGVNDVTVTKLAGIADPAYLDKFGGIYATNNPDFIVQFIGAKNIGTGDGVAGDILDMQTSGGLVLQFDFARQFTPGDRLFLVDVDNDERYQVQAYARSGTGYTPVSVAGWTVRNYPGQTQKTPDASWPLWNPTNGVLASQGAGFNSEIVALAPDQPVDRVVVSQVASGSPGSTDYNATFQFVVAGNATAATHLLGSGLKFVLVVIVIVVLVVIWRWSTRPKL